MTTNLRNFSNKNRRLIEKVYAKSLKDVNFISISSIYNNDECLAYYSQFKKVDWFLNYCMDNQLAHCWLVNFDVPKSLSGPNRPIEVGIDYFEPDELNEFEDAFSKYRGVLFLGSDPEELLPELDGIPYNVFFDTSVLSTRTRESNPPVTPKSIKVSLHIPGEPPIKSITLSR